MKSKTLKATFHFSEKDKLKDKEKIMRNFFFSLRNYGYGQFCIENTEDAYDNSQVLTIDNTHNTIFCLIQILQNDNYPYDYSLKLPSFLKIKKVPLPSDLGKELFELKNTSYTHESELYLNKLYSAIHEAVILSYWDKLGFAFFKSNHLPEHIQKMRKEFIQSAKDPGQTTNQIQAELEKDMGTGFFRHPHVTALYRSIIKGNISELTAIKEQANSRN